MSECLEFVNDYRPEYAAQIVPGLPGTGETIQFTATSRRHQPEGLVVEVVPRSSMHRRWIGNFECGDGKRHGIFASPNPRQLFVVAGGRGYLVDVAQPSSYELVICYPIEHTLCLPDLQLLLFADFTRVSAYGTDGVVWITPDISWDGLRFGDLSPDGIHGRAWNAPTEEWLSFKIDPTSGHVTGGAAPPRIAEA